MWRTPRRRWRSSAKLRRWPQATYGSLLHWVALFGLVEEILRSDPLAQADGPLLDEAVSELQTAISLAPVASGPGSTLLTSICCAMTSTRQMRQSRELQVPESARSVAHEVLGRIRVRQEDSRGQASLRLGPAGRLELRCGAYRKAGFL